MLREFIANAGAEFWGIGTTLFFFAIFVIVALRVLTRKRGSYDSVARLPLEDDAAETAGTSIDESRTRGD